MTSNTEMFRAAASILVLTSLMTSSVCDDNPGTTPNLEDIFVGRCWDYDVTKYQGLLPRVDEDCELVWEQFQKGFGFMPPCDVSTDGYSRYFKSTTQKLPRDKVLFWSGVFSLAHQYSSSGQQHVTLEDTMMGYLVNGLTWCGQSSNPGMNMTRCPSWSDCPLESSESFWAGSSTAFAKEATGNVTLMLGGSNPDRPAYKRNSFFAKFELPNLSDQVVTSVNVLVSHTLDGPKLETCNNGSLLLLKEDVEARGLHYTCQDDPITVLHLLCADDPTVKECRLLFAHMTGNLTYPHQDKPHLFNHAPLDRFNNDY